VDEGLTRAYIGQLGPDWGPVWALRAVFFVRIGPIRFLARCCKRRLNQG